MHHNHLLQDILNHLMDDLEDFIASVRERAAAWQELEKKKKKSKKRKGDGESCHMMTGLVEGLAVLCN